MKNSIRHLSAAVLLAAFTTTTAQAGTHLVTQGRAGYAVVLDQQSQPSARNSRRETNVALVVGKPDRATAQVQNFGRAGFRVVPARIQNR